VADISSRLSVTPPKGTEQLQIYHLRTRVERWVLKQQWLHYSHCARTLRGGANQMHTILSSESMFLSEFQLASAKHRSEALSVNLFLYVKKSDVYQYPLQVVRIKDKQFPSFIRKHRIVSFRTLEDAATCDTHWCSDTRPRVCMLHSSHRCQHSSKHRFSFHILESRKREQEANTAWPRIQLQAM
jgi:hypothetical protein